jgi:hypothetical protein
MGLRSDWKAARAAVVEERREKIGKVIEQTVMRETAVTLGLEGAAAEPIPWEDQPQAYRESYRRVADAALEALGL